MKRNFQKGCVPQRSLEMPLRGRRKKEEGGARRLNFEPLLLFSSMETRLHSNEAWRRKGCEGWILNRCFYFRDNNEAIVTRLFSQRFQSFHARHKIILSSVREEEWRGVRFHGNDYFVIRIHLAQGSSLEWEGPDSGRFWIWASNNIFVGIFVGIQE